MNALQKIDDITAFLGQLPPQEYELRKRIRTYRNAASFKPTTTESCDARTLCWIASETASMWLYSPASIEQLEEVARYLRRLLILADQADVMEAL